ncbi:hypothetical protein POM88_029921 [Heracleum sosnowskyi]|uniref:Uncharacterized protein n=1 Tax=Heracleum sosnowskyi TaxID=360622 RepID=A0AAD8MIX2_9APIA|nr:hypothetical protein POM88_029921 [Heracleum sosnowskyi]
MVDFGPLWSLPKEDFIKVNVHSFFSEEPLENGNTSGIEIFFRNDRGTIIRMYGGTLGIQEKRLNEFYAMLYGLRKAFFENFNLLELESNHAGAYWGWRFEHLDGVIPEHQYVVRQINTMKADKNSIIEIEVISEESNRLATYLAEHGARTWDRMVELEAPFGRVKEIWYNDMGLGPIGPQFETVCELDLAVVVVNEDGGIVEDEEMV